MRDTKMGQRKSSLKNPQYNRKDEGRAHMSPKPGRPREETG